ncbi:response regulator [Sphingomicrobium marinum]|uniref:response regulator n=1 Tax=Sphingomicrobium marinum TaxID=1227950 RepID=UPI00223EBD8E|nr:response regulator [Sphingomicrobium marinum]
MGEARRILIVEDEPLIAMMLGDLIADLGHEVEGVCDTLAEAHAAVDAGGFDLAILDVHLGDEDVWPVAEALQQQGTPFLVASGGHIDPPPRAFEHCPMLAKPYTREMLGSLLHEALADT